jgi:hypothetical protein
VEEGAVRGKEKTPARNEGVEEAGSFKENGAILYFSRNDYLILTYPSPPGKKSMTGCHAFLLQILLI